MLGGSERWGAMRRRFPADRASGSSAERAERTPSFGASRPGVARGGGLARGT